MPFHRGFRKCRLPKPRWQINRITVGNTRWYWVYLWCNGFSNSRRVTSCIMTFSFRTLKSPILRSKALCIGAEFQLNTILEWTNLYFQLFKVQLDNNIDKTNGGRLSDLNGLPIHQARKVYESQSFYHSSPGTAVSFELQVMAARSGIRNRRMNNANIADARPAPLGVSTFQRLSDVPNWRSNRQSVAGCSIRSRNNHCFVHWAVSWAIVSDKCASHQT